MTRGGRPRPPDPAWRRQAAAFTAAWLLAVPFLVLLPLGALWLLQQGWLLWWMLPSAVLAGLAASIPWGLRRAARRRAEAARAADDEEATPPPAGWAPREVEAWQAVQTVAAAAAADGTALTDRDALIDLARNTVETVARHYHPGSRDPLLAFTLPELLLLTERVSARLRRVLVDQVPYADRIRIGQALWARRLTSLHGAAKQGYRIYRALRFANPLAAIAAEVRDHWLDQVAAVGGDWVQAKIVRLWVEEVGRAAIDLYSGALRADAARLSEAAAREGLGGLAEPAALPGALRLLVAGQTKSGKSSLVNALLEETEAAVDVLPTTDAFTAHALERAGMPEAVLVDAPGLDDRTRAAVVERALGSDLALWVAPAHRADRGADRAALDALRAAAAADPSRRPPPVLVVASHVDRLSPVRQWEPPYDVARPTSDKARTIRAAIEALAEDLGVPLDSVVPARLDAGHLYNVEVVWDAVAARLDEAKRTRLLRCLKAATGASWRDRWRQLAGAGRMVADLARR